MRRITLLLGKKKRQILSNQNQPVSLHYKQVQYLFFEHSKISNHSSPGIIRKLKRGRGECFLWPIKATHSAKPRDKWYCYRTEHCMYCCLTRQFSTGSPSADFAPFAGWLLSPEPGSNTDTGGEPFRPAVQHFSILTL